MFLCPFVGRFFLPMIQKDGKFGKKCFCPLLYSAVEELIWGGDEPACFIKFLQYSFRAVAKGQIFKKLSKPFCCRACRFKFCYFDGII